LRAPREGRARLTRALRRRDAETTSVAPLSRVDPSLPDVDALAVLFTGVMATWRAKPPSSLIGVVVALSFFETETDPDCG